MHSLVKIILFISALSPTFAMDAGDIQLSTLPPTSQTVQSVEPSRTDHVANVESSSDESDLPLPHQTVQSVETPRRPPVFNVQSSFDVDDEVPSIPVRLNTVSDVENIGCEVCCLTTSRKFWTFMTGPTSFLGGVANSAKTALSTAAAVVRDPTTKRWLGAAATITSVSSLTLNLIASYGVRRATTAQHELAEVEEKSRLIIEKYIQTTSTTPLFKYGQSDRQFSTPDKEKLSELRAQYKNLTELSGCEKSCFSYSNCLLRNTQSIAEIAAIFLDTVNIVLVPLTTIPFWDESTLAYLDIAILCTEGVNVVVKEIVKRSQLTNSSMEKFEKTLLGDNSV